MDKVDLFIFLLFAIWNKLFNAYLQRERERILMIKEKVVAEKKERKKVKSIDSAMVSNVQYIQNICSDDHLLIN